jgi:hypothetical protein
MEILGREASSDPDAVAARAHEDALWQGTTASFGVWPFAELARHHGLPIEQFCELAGIEPSALRDPNLRLAQSVANRVAELAQTHFGPDAGIAAAQTVEAGHFNLIELIARTAPTVADGLEHGCQFFPLVHAGGRLMLEVRSDGARALRWWPSPVHVVHPAYIELSFGVVLRGIRRETGQDSLEPTEVWFTHDAPPDDGLYHRVFGAGVKFAMPYACMAFSPKVSALPLTRKNSDVHAAATDVARELLGS